MVGVYENVRGTPKHALIFREEALAVLDVEEVRIAEVLNYRQVREWEWYSKDPIARALTVVMEDGRRVEVPCYGTKGAVSSLASFVGRASRLAKGSPGARFPETTHCGMIPGAVEA